MTYLGLNILKEMDVEVKIYSILIVIQHLVGGLVNTRTITRY